MAEGTPPLGGRSDYAQRVLSEGDLHADPLTQFQRWVDAAIAADPRGDYVDTGGVGGGHVDVALGDDGAGQAEAPCGAHEDHRGRPREVPGLP